MNSKITRFIGGARIGRANITWPFARFEYSNQYIRLNASILGSYIFTKEDIVSLEYYSGFLFSGIKINHRVPNINKHMVFWTPKAKSILSEINNSEFYTISQEKTVRVDVNTGLIQPFKVWVLWTIASLLFILFLGNLLDFFLRKNNGPILGICALIGFMVVAVNSGLFLLSSNYRDKVLNVGAEEKDLRPFVWGLFTLSTVIGIVVAYVNYNY